MFTMGNRNRTSVICSMINDVNLMPIYASCNIIENAYQGIWVRLYEYMYIKTGVQ